MVTEDYVSFETAKLLKEKGFKGECLGVYFPNGRFDTFDTAFDYNLNDGNLSHAINAPTLQMTMKWLREVHNIHISIDIHWLHFAGQNGWMYIITKILENGTDYIDSNGDENDKHFYSTYEEAVEAAIKYCLENLI